MTATLTVTCDYCGETITSDRHLLRVASGSLSVRVPEIDLCEPCFSAFLSWLGEARTWVDPDASGGPGAADPTRIGTPEVSSRV